MGFRGADEEDKEEEKEGHHSHSMANEGAEL